MSTHNICFHGEIRKISVFFGWKKSTLSGSIALDKERVSIKKYLYFSYFLTKTYVVGTH